MILAVLMLRSETLSIEAASDWLTRLTSRKFAAGPRSVLVPDAIFASFAATIARFHGYVPMQGTALKPTGPVDTGLQVSCFFIYSQIYSLFPFLLCFQVVRFGCPAFGVIT